MSVVLPVFALVALLVTAYRHLSGWWEAAIGLAAAGVALLSPAASWTDTTTEVRRLLPVVGFLCAILVVSACCRSAGLFAAIGDRTARIGGSGRTLGRLYAGTFVAAALTTVALSLDATVVLLTPVVVSAARSLSAPNRPFSLLCVRLANSASLLLPVSNLTNLLAMSRLDLSFARFAWLMWPSWVAVLIVEYAATRTLFRDDLRSAPAHPRAQVRPMPWRVLAVVVAMLALIALGSFWSIKPVWPALLAAVVLAVADLARRRQRPREVGHSAHLGFGLFVLCLGVVVEVLGDTALGDGLRHLVPSTTGLGALLLLAVVGAALANLVNNLPATLLLLPLAAPLGTTALLALLVGINVGSSLTWTGSLANLLWRRTLRHAGEPVSARDFHLGALLAAPAALVLGVVVLAGWSGLVG